VCGEFGNQGTNLLFCNKEVDLFFYGRELLKVWWGID